MSELEVPESLDAVARPAERVYAATVVEPHPDKPDCIAAELENGILVFVEPWQKWWPLDVNIGETVAYQPANAIEFRPVEDRHYADSLDVIESIKNVCSLPKSGALDDLVQYYELASKLIRISELPVVSLEE